MTAKYFKYAMALLVCLLAGACSDFTPTGYTESPDLPTANSLSYTIGGEGGHDVIINWIYPAGSEAEGAILLRDAKEIARFDNTSVTSYTVKGQEMGVEVLYTVKVLYKGGYCSEGVTVPTTLPAEELSGVSNLTADVDGRTVTLRWTLPTQSGRTGLKVYVNGDTDAAISLPADATTFTLKGQAMEKELTYSVVAVYDTYYASQPVSVTKTIPYMAPRMLYLMTAPTIAQLPDDDERAAATWFAAQPDAYLIQPSEIADYDPGIYSVMWIEIDRKGMQLGWQNLPSQLTDAATIASLKEYSANGGSIYLSNMATQLTVPLGFVPDNMAPTVFGNGDGGTGSDVWLINAYLGWDFRNGSDQGFYDRTGHDIFKGLTFEDPNGYGFNGFPLIGPGEREDHNCLWDCNLYGRGGYPDVIKNFEVTTNSLVLATWGHVRDHCVAGLVEFYSNADHGRCIANGFAAYEWNQNSGTNPYQKNVEKLTQNILDYLK